MNNNVKDLIEKDYFRYVGDATINLLTRVRLYGWQYTKIWRKTNYYYHHNCKFLYFFYGILLYHLSLKYGFQISPRAHIGHGLYLGHFGTIVVGNNVVIGDNVNLNPNVVIGSENRGKRCGSPKIGDRVWVGTGSVIVGNITIGNNVLIAPNSFVNFDIPDNSLIIGNPPRIKSDLYATDSYICNIVE